MLKTVGSTILGAIVLVVIVKSGFTKEHQNEGCVIFPDNSVKIPDGLVPCIITNYISGWTEYANCVRNGVVKPGSLVMMTAMNKILGLRGDVDKNGECEPRDAWEFSNCMTEDDSLCKCIFDYDQDDDLDLADFQHVQNAVGTGNITWRKEHYPLNCCRSWD